MISHIIVSLLIFKISSAPCSNHYFSTLDEITDDLIEKDFTGLPVVGFGMWHKWSPLLKPDLVKSTELPNYQLFLELDSRKKRRLAYTIYIFVDDSLFYAYMQLYEKNGGTTYPYFIIDSMLMEGKWAYAYFCQKAISSIDTEYSFFYYISGISVPQFAHYVSGISNYRTYNDTTYYSQSFYTKSDWNYRQFLGYKGELQFTTTYYNTVADFVTAIEGSCSFLNLCPNGFISNLFLPIIANSDQLGKSFQEFYYESNYAFSGWIKLNPLDYTRQTQNSLAMRVATFPFYTDNYMQGDRQIYLTYSQFFYEPENTTISIDTFSEVFGSLTFYKSRDNDIWSVSGLKYEDEITKWHYFSFQHGQHVVNEAGFANTKIYFKFSSFEITDYFLDKKRHFTDQLSQITIGNDKFRTEIMQGSMAYFKLDYCFGSSYTLKIDCNNLCQACSGPQSDQCTQCYPVQQRILIENQCECKRNYNENVDPTILICEDMITSLGGNIIEQVPLINQCNDGQFTIKFNGSTFCSNCPSPKGNYLYECADCQINPHYWYINPICTVDYENIQQTLSGAFRLNNRISIEYSLYTISDELDLELCLGCERFIENTETAQNFVKKWHLGVQKQIQCKNCHLAINNECVRQSDNCDLCDSATFECFQCSSNYKLLNNRCTQCPDLCPDCEVDQNRLKCTTCPQNYYLSDGNCYQCGKNCSICNKSGCYKCIDTSLYYISLDGKNCYPNPITNCQIAYEESLINPAINSLQKSYTLSTSTVIKCALCNLQTTNYQTYCQNDNLLSADQRALFFNGTKVILTFQQTIQGKYLASNKLVGSKIEVYTCTPELLCRSCVYEDSFYQDSWKQDIQSYYDIVYKSYNKTFNTDLKQTINGYVKCQSCLAGYDLYNGKCILQCPSNCKSCQYINNQAICVECKQNQNGKSLTLNDKNECVVCPQNCALCKSRSQDQIKVLNPHFNPDYNDFLIFSYICLKSYVIPGVNLNYDFELINYAECSDANPCQQIAVINQNLYCESQASYSNYDKYIGDLTTSKFEQFKVLRALNLKVVKKITVKITLIKGTGQCIFPKDFAILSKLKSNVFSLLEVNLEFEGTQDVIFNSNFKISGFDSVMLKNFDVVSNSKLQQILIQDPNQYKFVLSNFNLKVTNIQFEINIKNATSIDINQFTIKDSSLLNSNGIFSVSGYLYTTDVITTNIQQVTINNTNFQNNTIFRFDLSQNFNNQNIQISQLTLENNIYESSYVFKTNFTLNARQSIFSLTQIVEKQDQFISSNFVNFEGAKLVDFQEILLESSSFSQGAVWMILPLFRVQNLVFKENYLITNDVTLISNKASAQYSDVGEGNLIELKSISFEKNKYLGNKAFIEIYQSTFLNMEIHIDQLLLDQNYLHTLNKLSSKYIASENSTIYLEINNLILTNANITRSKSFPELAVLNSQSVIIKDFQVQRNSESLKLLNNEVDCVYVNIIPQAYTTILFLYNIQEIKIEKMTIIGIKAINQALVQIKSSDKLNIIQSETITITDSYFAENLLILSSVSEIQSIISIISQQNQNVVISDSKFLYNYQHSYISDLSFVSSSTLLFQSPNSKILLNRMNFEKNIATNGQNSNLVLQCKSIIIQTSSFLQSNQLEFRIVSQNIVWGLSENYIPRQEEYFLAFPIKTFGGSAYLSANTTYINNVNVIGSVSLLGGAFYLLPASAGILQFSNIIFQDCHASLDQVSNAQGGSIFIDASQSKLQASFYNCTFLNSYSRREGGVIYVIPSNEKNQIEMENIVVQNSYSIYYSFIKVFGQTPFNFWANNFTLQNSYDGYRQYLGQLYELSQIEVSDNSNNYLFSFYGNLYLYNATISDYMVGLFQISKGELELISVTISDFIMANQPALDLTSINWISFYNVIFFNISLFHLTFETVPLCEVSYQALPLTCDYLQEAPTFIDQDMNQTIITYYSNLNLKKIQQIQSSPSSFISIKNIQKSDSISFQKTIFQFIRCSTCQNGLISMIFQDFYELGSNIVTLENIQLVQSQCGKISCFSLKQDSSRLLQTNNRILVNEEAKFSIIYTVKVVSSIFENNQGTYGGVFYVNNINIIFDKCKFLSNVAAEAGGTIYFISKQASMNIYDSEANSNEAKIGGAFFLSNYTLNSPATLNLQLRNNVATKFGKNYAEYPNQLTLSLNGGNSFLEKTLLLSNTSTVIDLITIKPYNVSNQEKKYLTLPSGQAINSYKYFDETQQQFLSYNLTFRIVALNKQQNKIENLDGTKCSIFSKRISIADQNLADAEPLDNSTAQSPFTSVEEVTFNTTSQDYNLDEMIVYFDPKQNFQQVLQIEFLCNSVRIPVFSSDPPFLMKNQIENYRLRVHVQSFDCQVGEQKRDEDGTCLVCDSQQDQYSVQAGQVCQIKDTISTEAVTSASVKLRAGYWRPYSYSTKIEYCLNMATNCEGGWLPGDQSCYIGHIGALCEQCDIYGINENGQWSVSTQYKCGNCNSLEDNTIKIVLISTWTIISIMLSVKSTMETVNNMVLGKRFSKYFVEKPKTGYGGILIKVLTNYLQIIGVVATFQLSLPSALTTGVKTVGSPVESMSYSLDCFLTKISDINIMYFRMIWALIMPLIYITVFFILYGVAVLINMASASKSAITTTFIYLFTFLQPTLLGGFISLLSFRQISNIYWVQGNVSYRYDTQQHLKWIIGFLFPSTFTLSLVIPIYMFQSLYRIQNKLDDEQSRKNWGYLYNEYQPKAYFWEIVKIFQKSFIIIFLTFYEDLIIIKAALIFIIVFIYSLLTKKYRPYKLPYLNYMDDVSTLVCGTSIVLGMTLYSANISDNQEIIWPFYVFLLFINGVFLAVIAWEILWAQLEGQEEALDKIRAKINSKYPNLQHSNWFLKKLLTNRYEQRKRVKARWRKIREYLMGITKSRKRNSNIDYEQAESETSFNFSLIEIPKYYQNVYPEIQIQQNQNNSSIYNIGQIIDE